MPVNTIPNLLSTPHTPTRVSRVIFFSTLTSIYVITLHASARTNTKYSFLSRKIMQQKYIKGILAKVNSGEISRRSIEKNLDCGIRKS